MLDLCGKQKDLKEIHIYIYSNSLCRAIYIYITLLTCIREMPGLNLGFTSPITEVFSWFYSSILADAAYSHFRLHQ